MGMDRFAVLIFVPIYTFRYPQTDQSDGGIAAGICCWSVERLWVGGVWEAEETLFGGFLLLRLTVYRM